MHALQSLSGNLPNHVLACDTVSVCLAESLPFACQPAKFKGSLLSLVSFCPPVEKRLMGAISTVDLAKNGLKWDSKSLDRSSTSTICRKISIRATVTEGETSYQNHSQPRLLRSPFSESSSVPPLLAF